MRNITSTALPTLLITLLQACSMTPESGSGMREVTPGDPATAATQGGGGSEGDSEEVPQLTLNLPEEQDVACLPDTVGRDLTFLERGFGALTEGDHVEAVQYFQRYQRLEKSPAALWESEVAIAYISTLQHSPFYDADEARKSSRRLRRQRRDSWTVDERVELMALSLESFRVMYRHVDDLEDTNATLREDLEKREEALKRLRELTLGQQGGRQ